MASSSGNSSSLILEDGSIVSTGNNSSGELGLGHNSATRVYTPVPSAGVNNIKVVHGGNTTGSSFILKANGDLYGTGYNRFGQLGIGLTVGGVINNYTFVMSEVADVSVSAYNTLILKKDGTVWVSGYNYAGELGLGNATKVNIFEQVVSLGNDNDFVCSGQYYNSYVIKKDGRLFHSGNSSYSPGVGGSTTFVEVPSMGNDNLYVASSYGAVILKRDGSVFSFGAHHGGKGGNVTPTQDTELGYDNISVIAGQNNYYVLKSNGEIWGVANATGYHGYSGISSVNGYTKAVNFGNDNVEFGLTRANSGYFVLKTDGTLYGNGTNGNGELGLGNTTTYADPQLLFNGKRIIGISGTILRTRSFVTTMVSYSLDGVSFSPFATFDYNNIPQARFLKFRSEFSGGDERGKVIELEFDQDNPETKVQINEFLESINQDIKMKTIYTQPFIQDESYESGKLYEVEVERTKWKDIKRLDVL